MMPFTVMTASIVIIFLIIIGRGHARPDSTPRRPASAACGCTRQDRGAFAALQGLSSSSIPVFDDIVHVERAASMTLSRRQRAELKRGEGRCSCGLNAVRSQVAADGSCRSLPMAVADRCRWLLPMALADRCRWPLPIVADGRCRSLPLSASSQTSLCLLDAGLAGLIKSPGASLSLESYHSPSSRST